MAFHPQALVLGHSALPSDTAGWRFLHRSWGCGWVFALFGNGPAKLHKDMNFSTHSCTLKHHHTHTPVRLHETGAEEERGGREVAPSSAGNGTFHVLVAFLQTSVPSSSFFLRFNLYTYFSASFHNFWRNQIAYRLRLLECLKPLTKLWD